MRILAPIQLIIILAIALPLCMLLAIVLGAVNVSLTDTIRVLFSFSDNISHVTSSTVERYHSIIVSIRLPRVLLAATIGALLAASGAVTQGLFRNPLADPSLIGVTAGASLGGSVMIFLLSGSAFAAMSAQWAGVVLPVVAMGAFVGGLLAVYVVYTLANNQYGTSVATMLLAGIGITALASSMTSLLEFISDNELLRRISMWRMGGLEGADTISVSIAFGMVVIMAILLPRYSQGLNALLLGESEARHLGVNVESLKRRLIVLVAACVGISVALGGTITFVGLVVPHIVRLLIGPNHRYLIPASALLGAILLVVADMCARLLLAPTELPVGLVTAIIGVPFFISLLKRRHIYGAG